MYTRSYTHEFTLYSLHWFFLKLNEPNYYAFTLSYLMNVYRKNQMLYFLIMMLSILWLP